MAEGASTLFLASGVKMICRRPIRSKHRTVQTLQRSAPVGLPSGSIIVASPRKSETTARV